MAANVDRPASFRRPHAVWTVLFVCFGLWAYTFRAAGFTVFSTFSNLHEHATGMLMAVYILHALGVCVVPCLLDRTALQKRPGMLRPLLAGLCAATLLIMTLWFAAYALGVRNTPVQAAVYGLLVLCPSVGMGLSLRRAVLHWRPSKAVLCVGALYTAFYAVFSVFNLLSYKELWLAYIALALALFVLLLVVALVALRRLRDDPPPGPETLTMRLSDNLLRGVALLAALYCLYSVLIKTGFYYDELPSSFAFTAAYSLVTLAALLAATLLLWRGKWAPTIALCMMLLCFSQGLLLYPLEGGALALAYCLINAAGSFPLIIAVYAFPVAVCAARRKAGLFVAFGFGLLDLLEGVSIHFSMGDEPALPYPAILLPLGLLLTAATFFAFQSYQRAKTRRLLDDMKPDRTTRRDPLDALDGLALTPRERELATLLLTGEAPKLIAARMGVSYSTVRFHSNNLYRKLNIQSRAELFHLLAPPPDAAPAPAHNQGATPQL